MSNILTLHAASIAHNSLAYIFAASRVVPQSETGIAAVTGSQQPTITGYYTPDGMKTSRPTSGLYIVRYSDGTSRKVVVK